MQEEESSSGMALRHWNPSVNAASQTIHAPVRQRMPGTRRSGVPIQSGPDALWRVLSEVLREGIPWNAPLFLSLANKSGVVGSKFAEGAGDGEPGGADGGEETADEANDGGAENSLDEQAGGDAEGEGDLAEALPVHGGSAKSIENPIGNAAADGAAEQGEQQGFDEDGNHDRGAAEAEGAEGGDLAGSSGDGGIHGIEGAKDGADRHERGDEGAEARDKVVNGAGLFEVIVGLEQCLRAQARVVLEVALERGKGGGRRELDDHTLIAVATLVGVLEHGGVGPDLGFSQTAPGREKADNGPVAASHANGRAEIESGKFTGGAHADDDFVEAGDEAASLMDAELVMNGKGVRADAAEGDIGVGAGGAFGKVDDREEFAGGERTVRGVGDTWGIGDQTGFGAGEEAHHLSVRTATENDGFGGVTGAGHDLAEALGDGEDGDEDGDDTGDAEHGGGAGAFAFDDGFEAESGDRAGLGDPVG